MSEPVVILLHTYSARFQFWHRPAFDVFAFIDTAAALGFHGVALSANDENYRHLESKAPAQFRRIRHHLQQQGLLCDLDTSGTAPDHLRTMIEVARQLGARNLRTYTRYAKAGALPRSIADLRQIGDDAAAAGVTVLLENHETFTGQEIAEILAQVDHPHVQALFDYGNSQMVLEEPAVALQAMLPYARSAHIKDHVVWPDPHGRQERSLILSVPLGQGSLPIQELTRTLYQHGLREFVYEDSWGYHAPINSEAIRPETLTRLGQGSFQFASPPLDNDRFWLDTNQLPPERLVKRQYDALITGWSWLQRQFAELGIPLTSTSG